MTPTAVTPAATRTKRATPKRAASPHPSTPRPAHREPRGRTASPRSTRRVSGPVQTSGSRAAVSAPSPAPAKTPRRVSGPARPARRAAANAPAVRITLSERSWAALRTLPDHSLLDRVIRGRLWIPLLGVLLVGIVAMQVEVLKLNASIGDATVRSAQLQSQDQLLQSAVSRLSDDQRIMSDAAGSGMGMPAPSTPLYLSGGGSAELGRAISNITAPDSASFAARASAGATARAAQVTASSGA